MILEVGIIFLAVVIGGVLVVFAGQMGRRKIFAGPARDAWERARRKLSPRDRLQVQRATMGRRPVSRSALAPAQLTYSRYVQYVSERSPMRRRPLRVTVGILYAACAVLGLANGIIDPQGRALSLVEAVLFMGTAFTWILLIPRSLAQKPTQMSQLRRQVMERYPDAY